MDLTKCYGCVKEVKDRLRHWARKHRFTPPAGFVCSDLRRVALLSCLVFLGVNTTCAYWEPQLCYITSIRPVEAGSSQIHERCAVCSPRLYWSHGTYFTDARGQIHTVGFGVFRSTLSKWFLSQWGDSFWKGDGGRGSCVRNYKVQRRSTSIQAVMGNSIWKAVGFAPDPHSCLLLPRVHVPIHHGLSF